MSDDLDLDDGQQEYTLTRKDAKRLTKEAQEGREAKLQLAQLERERAFVRAGIPIDDKRASYFIAGYSGDVDPTAIKAKWDEDFGTPGVGETRDPDLDELAAGQELVGGGSSLPPNRLAERDQKLATLNGNDPQYTQKFQAIFDEYGGRSGSLVG